MQTPNTLRALEAAARAQVLAPNAVADLHAAYLFFRRAEIRLHTALDVQGSALEAGTGEWAAWARAVFPSQEDAGEVFRAAWGEHAAKVRGVFEAVRAAL